jgi:tellurite resistance protein TehA-like permease
MQEHQSRWRSAVGLVGALLLGAFSVAGYLTVGMLQPTGYRTTAWIYLGLFAFSLVAAAGIAFLRRRGRNPSRPAI